MSTLRQLGIEDLKITEIVGEPVERIASVGGPGEGDEFEYDLTLKVTLYTREDVEVLRRMLSVGYDGSVMLYTSY